MTIRFEPLAEHHIPDAAVLAHNGYLREVRHVPALTDNDVPDALRLALTDLVRRGAGVAAIDGERMQGYLGFIGPIEGFFGRGVGGFSPLHGSALTGEDRRLATRLFQHAAAPLVAQGVNTFAITTWHHDDATAAALVQNGFGMRCTDAIRMTDPTGAEPVPGIDYREVRWPDAGVLRPLVNGLVRHLRLAPSFVVADEFTESAFAERLERRRNRHFVAFDAETPIGYLEVTDEGENVLTTAPDMRSICGAFLHDPYRGHGVAPALLDVVLATLRTEGVRRIGVDFETLNPAALGFWAKHFDRYTTSFARRIDELA